MKKAIKGVKKLSEDQVKLSLGDKKMQKDIFLRANRSMPILNRALRRHSGRPIGMHLDLRPDDFIRQLPHMR